MTKTLIAAGILLSLPAVGMGQCSDAGICSLADHEPGYGNERPLFVGVAYRYAEGSSADDVTFSTVEVKARYQISDRYSLLGIIPVVASQSGPLGTVTGIGDAIVKGSYRLVDGDERTLDLETGLKLATGDANKDPTLPQVYQTGLGTTDVLIGLNYKQGALGLSVGYQWVPSEYNDNALAPLKRGDDVFLQGSYTWEIGGWNLTGIALAIQRLEESEIQGTGTIADSAQLQANIGGKATYNYSETQAVSVEFARPLLSRDVNVDGLARSRSVTISWQAAF